MPRGGSLCLDTPPSPEQRPPDLSWVPSKERVQNERVLSPLLLYRAVCTLCFGSCLVVLQTPLALCTLSLRSPLARLLGVHTW